MFSIIRETDLLKNFKEAGIKQPWCQLLFRKLTSATQSRPNSLQLQQSFFFCIMPTMIVIVIVTLPLMTVTSQKKIKAVVGQKQNQLANTKNQGHNWMKNENKSKSFTTYPDWRMYIPPSFELHSNLITFGILGLKWSLTCQQVVPH